MHTAAERAPSADKVFMRQTKMSQVVLCQPQDRNIQNKIFGGYLMRLSFELAYATASSFVKSLPLFVALDEISFRKPVSIGSILAMDAEVTCSPGKPHTSFQVSVNAYCEVFLK